MEHINDLQTFLSICLGIGLSAARWLVIHSIGKRLLRLFRRKTPATATLSSH